MTHDEINAAVRLSLLMGDTRAERHGTYARRKPRHVSPIPAPLPVLPPAHVYRLPRVAERRADL